MKVSRISQFLAFVLSAYYISIFPSKVGEMVLPGSKKYSLFGLMPWRPPCSTF